MKINKTIGGSLGRRWSFFTSYGIFESLLFWYSPDQVTSRSNQGSGGKAFASSSEENSISASMSPANFPSKTSNSTVRSSRPGTGSRFVGEVVVVIFLPDPHHRFGAEVCLFDLMKREGPIVFRRCRDEKFAFDFHDKYPFWDAGGCGRRFDRQFL